MDDQVINFIRDRFDTLEVNLTEVKNSIDKGFALHEARIRSLEDTRLVNRTKTLAYGSAGGALFSFLAFLFGKVFF